MKKVMLLASKDMCDILRRELNNKYITLPCYDTADGIELLQSSPYALILELSLPEADGMAFLRANSNSLPPVIIVLTPYVNERILSDLTALGVSSVVLMPFRTSYLGSLLSRHLETNCPSR